MPQALVGAGAHPLSDVWCDDHHPAGRGVPARDVIGHRSHRERSRRQRQAAATIVTGPSIHDPDRSSMTNTTTTGLKSLRETTRPRVTQEQMAQALGVSVPSLRRWEAGRGSPAPHHLPIIAEQCRQPLAVVHAHLAGTITLGDGADAGWLDHVADIEQRSTSITAWESSVVHGLLQTSAYAAAVEASAPGVRPEVVDWIVETRLARQGILHHPARPTRLHVVMSEAALLAQAGGPAVMAGQLAHLLGLAQLANVTIQILPLSAGVFAGAAVGSLALMSTQAGSPPSVALTSDAAGPQLHLQPGHVAAHRDLLDHLAGQALTEADTVHMMQTMEDQLR